MTSDITIPESPEGYPPNTKVTNVPHPATVSSSIENPITLLLPVDMVIPAAAAWPPAAPIRVVPDTSN